MALAAPDGNVLEDVRSQLDEAPDNKMDQQHLIDELDDHSESDVLSAVKDLMRCGEVSYTRDWKLVLEESDE